MAALILLLMAIGDHVHDPDGLNISDEAGSLLFLALTATSWRISHRQRYGVADYIIVILLITETLQLSLNYGFQLPMALLLCSLSIVVAAILLPTRVGLITTAVLISILLCIGYGQVTGWLHADSAWRMNGYNSSDTMGFVAILGIIGGVSWLANREIDTLLRRAKLSEAALALERDNLEVKVAQRTSELEQTQFLRILELQRFAEFGRLSATLLHELASPLTAATLNLAEFSGTNSAALTRVRKNLQQIERYVVSARKQLQHQSNRQRFKIRSELDQVNALLAPLAKTSQIRLEVSHVGNYWLRGDPVKFNQLMGNLVINAIDASKESDSPSSKTILIAVSATEKWVELSVTDWGNGIGSDQLPHIFEPFYTTKSGESRGLGIGLALVKDFVENEFGGTIIVHSSHQTGTTFSVKLERSS